MLTHEIIEYIDAAVRTEKVPWFQFTNEIRAPEGQMILQQPTFKGVVGELKVRLLHSGLGMMTEISELQAALEKRDWVNVGEEVGDVLWYWAVAVHALQFSNLPARAPATPYMRTEARTGRPLIAAICAWGDLVRKDAIHSKAMKPEDALAALSDVLDEACTLCEAVSISPLQVMRRNIAKLRVRFPDKYDGVRFDQRDLEGERAALEEGTCPVHDGLDTIDGLAPESARATEFVKRIAAGKKCTCTKGAQGLDPVTEAMNILLSRAPAQREVFRTWHSGISSYVVPLADGSTCAVAAVDLAARCICIGLPPAPVDPGYCPKHPDR